MALGIGGEAKAGLFDRAAFADAGQHILQLPPLGQVIEHVVGGDQWQPRRLGQCCEMCKTASVVTAIKMMRGEIGAVPEIGRDTGGKIGELRRNCRRCGGQHDDDLAHAVGGDIGIIETAFAL